jgi:hypothetical protein
MKKDQNFRDTVSLRELSNPPSDRTIVEQEQDPPLSLIKLNSVAEKEEGWLQVNTSFPKLE